MRRTYLGLLLLGIAGCATTNPAVTPGVKLRSDTRPQCEAMCEQMDMRLGAVVVIRDSAGCVCEPDEVASRNASAATAAGGMMLVSIAEEEAAVAERQRVQEAERQRREAEEREERERQERKEREERERTTPAPPR